MPESIPMSGLNSEYLAILVAIKFIPKPKKIATKMILDMDVF